MKSMKRLVIGAFFAGVISCAGGGTETDNPATLKDFTSSSCKTKTPEPGQQALVLESDAEGLQCVEWSKNADASLAIRLLNFPEACGEDYQGTAALAADGSLQLAVHKSSCSVLKCGWCVFDFAYTLSNIDTSDALSMHLGAAICASEPATFTDEITLPVDERDSGVVCRYMARSPLEQYGRGRKTLGERNMPCGSGESVDATTCAAGLTCTAITDGDSRCLEDCKSDADCAGGLTTCQDGVCQANESW
jgi:hypothetical protein